MLKCSSLPVHVAFIMDGNRRWAQAQGIPKMFGHRKGVERLKDVLNMAIEAGVRYVTFFMFSTENWQRTKEEVSYLMDLFREALHNAVQEQHEKGVCVRAIGDMRKFPEDIQKLSVEAEEKTRNNTTLHVQFALNYGSRAEILQAVQAVAQDAREGKIDPESLTEENFAARLFTAGIPDPDLLIRTSGELRLSNFLLWQLAYAEFVFVDKHWPAFSREDFQQALDIYACRQRRHGR
ncbi:MAG: di-trans,poly-cis-decaprenylcistransferase [Holosporales bacterium]|jgi:undecaprenyl diphosphate synthase|nr:di-trans,poly-cis-decaprenylcistransferase [Holosporales bacterium]